MFLQLISNHFDFNFTRSYITTKSVLQYCNWMNKLNKVFFYFFLTNSTVSLGNEIPSKQVFFCFGSFLHLLKTKVFPHFWPGVSRIATDLQLVHFSRHVGLISNMLARHIWEETGNWGETGESEAKTNNCSSWIRGDIIFLWWFSCTYILRSISKLILDGSDTTNAKQWACNLCFGSVVYEIQSGLACHIFQINVRYLKRQQHSQQGTTR